MPTKTNDSNWKTWTPERLDTLPASQAAGKDVSSTLAKAAKSRPAKGKHCP
jgi:hypothetical protein